MIRTSKMVKIMSITHKRLWLPLLVLLMSACGGGGSNEPDPDTAPTNGVVKIMPVSGNAPILSLLVDADLEDENPGEALSELSHGQAAAFTASPRTYEVTARYALPDGASAAREYEQALPPFNVEVESATRYELYFGGEYGAAEYWTVETPLTFDESETQARLTLVNAAPGLPAMDIHLTVDGAPIDSSTLLATLNYKGSDNTIRVDEGDYQIKVTAAGSTTVVYASSKISVVKGTDLSFVAIDNAWVKDGVTGKSPIVLSRSTGTSTSSLMFDSAAGADIRAVNASPDAGLVDVILDDNFGAPFVQDLDLGQVTPYTSVTDGVHNVKLVPANGATAAVDANYNLFNGVSWTVFFMNPWAAVDPLFTSDNARAISAHPRLRVVHGSSLAEAVDLYITEVDADLGEENADGTPVFTPIGKGLSIKRATSYFAVAAGTYDLTFTRSLIEGEVPPDSPVVKYGPITVTLEAGEVYTLLLRDTATVTITHDWLDEVPAAI